MDRSFDRLNWEDDDCFVVAVVVVLVVDVWLLWLRWILRLGGGCYYFHYQRCFLLPTIGHQRSNFGCSVDERDDDIWVYVQSWRHHPSDDFLYHARPWIHSYKYSIRVKRSQWLQLIYDTSSCFFRQRYQMKSPLHKCQCRCFDFLLVSWYHPCNPLVGQLSVVLSIVHIPIDP